MRRPQYRIVVEASFADRVRAIRGLVEFYQRRRPERVAEILRAVTAQRPEILAASPR